MVRDSGPLSMRQDAGIIAPVVIIPNPGNVSMGMRSEEVAERLLTDPFSNITFSGGDPLEQVEAFTELAKLIKNKSKKNIWCYTGYRYEEVCRSARLAQILPYIDVLVDGRFNQHLRDTDLLFRGSSNQRLIDVPESLLKGKIQLYDYSPYPVIAV